ncbi:galactosylceramide sulfotransferase-like isoform X2 [Planococcus citri]|uniref:galactosylceramide sulfotransferase-like isoform X2 n=1 Tax=Planococcus citri TaxID=170843 RepID=UPI0031F9D7F4
MFLSYSINSNLKVYTRKMYLSKKKIAIKIQIFTLKHKTLLFSCICTSLALWILLSLSTNISSAFDQIQLKSNQNEPLAYTCCTPSNKSLRTNVYFVKTHKTGSTTVKNVILRFAFRNSLDVMDIIYNTYNLPFSDSSMHPHAKTPNNKYHIMAQHVRYDPALKSYQYPNTSMVTILRHPATQFQSKYEFLVLNKTTGMNLQQFLNAPEKPDLSKGGGAVYRGYNQLSVDLGFDKCVRQYGEQKMLDQIQQLKIINEKFAQRCIGEEIKKPLWNGGSEMIEFKPKDSSDVECVYAVASTFALADILKNYTKSKNGKFNKGWNFLQFVN